MWRIRLVACGLGLCAVVFGLSVAAALAAVTPGWECVPTSAGQPVLSGGTANAPSCRVNTTAVLAPSYVSAGVGGKPTVQFSTVNVQVVSGSGSTSGAVNGVGNLIVGYAENPNQHKQTGSNDLIIGANNGWASYGDIVGGSNNQATGEYATAVGASNTANGWYSFSAGHSNSTEGSWSSVLGGQDNSADGDYTIVAGGEQNSTQDFGSAVLGGTTNRSGGDDSSVVGGTSNATGYTADVAVGGDNNFVSGVDAVDAGGQGNQTNDAMSSILGGCDNYTARPITEPVPCTYSSHAYDVVAGGNLNDADGVDATVSAGRDNTATGSATAIAGGANEALSGTNLSQIGNTMFNP